MVRRRASPSWTDNNQEKKNNAGRSSSRMDLGSNTKGGEWDQKRFVVPCQRSVFTCRCVMRVVGGGGGLRRGGGSHLWVALGIFSPPFFVKSRIHPLASTIDSTPLRESCERYRHHGRGLAASADLFLPTMSTCPYTPPLSSPCPLLYSLPEALSSLPLSFVHQKDALSSAISLISPTDG